MKITCLPQNSGNTLRYREDSDDEADAPLRTPSCFRGFDSRFRVPRMASIPSSSNAGNFILILLRLILIHFIPFLIPLFLLMYS